jgi:hypothetical protein
VICDDAGQMGTLLTLTHCLAQSSMSPLYMCMGSTYSQFQPGGMTVTSYTSRSWNRNGISEVHEVRPHDMHAAHVTARIALRSLRVRVFEPHVLGNPPVWLHTAHTGGLLEPQPLPGTVYPR